MSNDITLPVDAATMSRGVSDPSCIQLRWSLQARLCSIAQHNIADTLPLGNLLGQSVVDSAVGLVSKRSCSAQRMVDAAGRRWL